MTKIQQLQKQIKNSFTKEQLEENNVPKEEISYLLKYKIFPIDLLVRADWNYKTDDEVKSQKLRNNIKRIGQVENIQVRKLETGYYEVINGNHRLDNLIELGKAFVVAYDHGNISLSEAKRIAIETNETRFESDHLKLAELFSDIKLDFDIPDLVDTMPFDEIEIENFQNLLDFNWEQPNETDKPNSSNSEQYKIIEFKVPEETYNSWLKLQDRMLNILGYDNEAKVFEFAVIEALNIPEESLKV